MRIFDGTEVAFPAGAFNALHLTRFRINFRAQTKYRKALPIIILGLLESVGCIISEKVLRRFDGTEVAFPAGAFNALHLTRFRISFHAQTKCRKTLPIIILGLLE